MVFFFQFVLDFMVGIIVTIGGFIVKLVHNRFDYEETDFNAKTTFFIGIVTLILAMFFYHFYQFLTMEYGL